MGKIRTCYFCGKDYEYCPNCAEYKSYPDWAVNFDSEKCHDLYQVMAGYGIGVKTIKDVKSELDRYKITDYSIFSQGFQDKLNALISEKKDDVKEKTEEIKDEDPYISRRIKKIKKYENRGRVSAEE